MSTTAQAQPLADRVRPKTLDQFIGQKHLVGKGKPLYLAITKNRIYSMIFWGPPGVGKTTLARIIATATNRPYFELSAVSAGKGEIRAIVEQVRKNLGKSDDVSINIDGPLRQRNDHFLAGLLDNRS